MSKSRTKDNRNECVGKIFSKIKNSAGSLTVDGLRKFIDELKYDRVETVYGTVADTSSSANGQYENRVELDPIRTKMKFQLNYEDRIWLLQNIEIYNINVNEKIVAYLAEPFEKLMRKEILHILHEYQSHLSIKLSKVNGNNDSVKNQKLKARKDIIDSLVDRFRTDKKEFLSAEDKTHLSAQLERCRSNSPEWSERGFLQKLTDILSLGIKPLFRKFFSKESSFKQKTRKSLFSDYSEKSSKVYKAVAKHYSVALSVLKKINDSSRFFQLTQNQVGDNVLQKALEQIAEEEKVNTQCKFKSLGGANNKVVKISVEGEEFICRLFPTPKKNSEKLGFAQQARASVTDVPYVMQPNILQTIGEVGNEIIHIEFLQYLPHGDLKGHMEEIRKQNGKEEDIDKIRLEVGQFGIQLVDFFQKINERNVWYTDLKPGNILLNEHEQIRISDAKGLIMSTEQKIDQRHTNTTPNYFSSAVCSKMDEGPYQIDLAKLQMQNLAVTLYQLLTNELPTMINFENQSGSIEDKLNFDFGHDVFADNTGKDFQSLINDLYEGNEADLDIIQKRLEKLNELMAPNTKAKGGGMQQST